MTGQYWPFHINWIKLHYNKMKCKTGIHSWKSLTKIFVQIHECDKKPSVLFTPRSNLGPLMNGGTRWPMWPSTHCKSGYLWMISYNVGLNGMCCGCPLTTVSGCKTWNASVLCTVPRCYHVGHSLFLPTQPRYISMVYSWVHSLRSNIRVR